MYHVCLCFRIAKDSYSVGVIRVSEFEDYNMEGHSIS